MNCMVTGHIERRSGRASFAIDHGCRKGLRMAELELGREQAW